jgi:hypothetical protein
MTERVTFSAFDPVRFDAPSHCNVCTSTAPVFHYEYSVDEALRQAPRKGFCCSRCAVRLLEKLQVAESRAWAQEEASLKAEDVDASDLEERRLPTFGVGQR